MLVEIKNPELQMILSQRIASHSAEGLEEILLGALHSAPPATIPVKDEHSCGSERPSLPGLFSQSPFRGIDLRIERDEDTGAGVSL